MGELIARERQGRSLSRRELAGLVRKADRTLRTDEKTIERWEVHGQEPQPVAMRALAVVLGRPVEELTALARQRKAQIHQEEYDTERRAFVGTLLAASFGMVDPELLAAAIGAPRTTDRRLLNDLDQLTSEYGRLYWHMKPAALWPTLYSHAAVTRHIHDAAPTALQHQAGRIASQSAALLGMLGHRLHRRLDSVMYLNLAIELAAEAQDGPLRAHALIALRAVYSPVTGAGPAADAGKALQLTTEAARVAGDGTSPLLRTWLHACRAEDHAMLGDAGEANRAMGAAEAALARATPGAAGFFEHWDSARLAGFRGNCAVLLGRPDDAIPVLEAVARDTSPALVAPYTAVLTDLAAAHAQRGDVDRACGILGDVLTTASKAGMPERAGRVRRARDAHLAGWLDARAVRQLDEHLLLFAEAL